MSSILMRLLADASLRVSVVAILVAAILGVLHVHSSRVRHASWTAVLSAMLLMPLLPYCVPAIAIPLSLPRSFAPDGVALEPLVALDGGDGPARGMATEDASSPPHTRTTPVAWSSPTPAARPPAHAPFSVLAALILGTGMAGRSSSSMIGT